MGAVNNEGNDFNVGGVNDEGGDFNVGSDNEVGDFHGEDIFIGPGLTLEMLST